MRITFEPTTPEMTKGEHLQQKVVIELPMDDVSIDKAASLIAAALVAYGYSPDSVKEIIRGEG